MPPTDIHKNTDPGAELRVSSQRSVSFSGPLPPPSVLRDYDELLPGAAERIFKSFEKQTEHRHKIESQVITHEINRSWGGLICALVVALTCIGGGVWCVIIGQPTAGTAIATASVVGLVGAFIYGSNLRSSERMKKAEVAPGEK